MEKSNFVVKEVYVYGFITILSVLMIFLIIPTGIQSGQPRLFPYIYSVALLLVGVISLIRIFVKKQSEQYQFNKKVSKFVGYSILIYFVYSLSIQYIGFFVMSILFILVLMRSLGEGWKIAILLSVILPSCIYLLFTKVLALYFPAGVLF
ncbi:tripartite tricarboxylate transporter TctB family protein [Bacillus dakarensis]|uniref:tripartite tricarboxylate transporter TctB family protein n=1 Tax=Robertmurraya dakarensis TaxID=1926278 RepID=UPI0009809939|nr:tripartite tricarboxylate transporter TctB family protein [Bacillus dakarensis]